MSSVKASLCVANYTIQSLGHKGRASSRAPHIASPSKKFRKKITKKKCPSKSPIITPQSDMASI
jgi:hypothetical protein